MQQIIPLYKSVGSLLSGNKFTIDEYQREYKWDQANIIDLVNDLVNKFLSCYSPGHTPGNVAKYEDYFLGSIILNRKDLGNNVIFAIVDGQQRITSLTLLLIHLFHIGTDQKLNQDILDEIKRMIYSDSWGNKAYNLDIPDREVVLDALFNRREINHEGHNESVRNMYERFQDIESENLDQVLGEAFEPFLYWVCKCVGVIEISCQNPSQAYDIFETMNDRGKPLSPVDMLKSYFLSYVSDPKKLDHLNSVWRNVAYRINTWDGGYYATREVAYFTIWFRSKYVPKSSGVDGGTSDRDSDRVNKALNRWARDNAQRLKWNSEDAVFRLIDHNLKYFSNIYISILKKSHQFNSTYDCIYYNDATDFSWQPTILMSAIKLDDNEDEISRKFRVVSKYIDIWIVSRFANGKRFRATDFSRELLELTTDIRDMDFSSLKGYLTDRIEKSELSVLGHAGKGGVRELRLNQYNKKGTRYILARISDFVQINSVGTSGTFFNWFMYKTDIEHIVEDHYERYSEEYLNSAMFDFYRNSIGALLLIGNRVNKSLKDEPFRYKKRYYPPAGFFASSLCEETYSHNPEFRDFIAKYQFQFKYYEKFGIEEIQERTELVASIASHIWSKDRILDIE